MRIHPVGSIVATLLICLTSGTVCAKDEVHIDASSDAAAKSSFDQMLAEAAPDQRQKLIVAMLELNLVGVNSAYDVVSNPALRNPSVVRVKDKIAGLTASEIIELANHTSSVKAEVHAAGK